MRQVLSDLLWIGNVKDVENISRVFDAVVTALLRIGVTEPELLRFFEFSD